MKQRALNISQSSAMLLILTLIPTVAQAYVDPGSGSVIVTTILGFIAAIGYTCRKYFYKLKRFIFGQKKEEHPNSEEQ